MAGPGQSRGKGKALESIAARSGRDPAAIIDSIQAAEKAQAKAEAAKQRAAKVEASKKAAAAKAASKKRGGSPNTDNEEDETTKATEVNQPSQIYSALSPQEQYRFQCYRRSGFASKPIEKFVAKMLVDEANRRFVARRGAVVGLGRKSSFMSNSSGHNNNMSGEEDEVAATVTDGSDLDQHTTNAHSNTNKKRKKPSKRQMLQEESKRRRIAMDQPPPYLLESFINNNNGGGGSGVSSARSSCLNSFSTTRGGGGNVPPLDQLVVPNSASEIVAVVSTLAKCYAQRLVSAARRVVDAEEGQEGIDNGSLIREAAAAAAKGKAPTATAQKPISPQHLLEAHRYRSRAGLDPGFWMADRVVDVRRRKEALSSSIQHASLGISEAAALGIEDRTRSCFLAAIAAQDAYDEARAKEAKEDGDVKMDIDKR